MLNALLSNSILCVEGIGIGHVFSCAEGRNLKDWFVRELVHLFYKNNFITTSSLKNAKY